MLLFADLERRSDWLHELALLRREFSNLPQAPSLDQWRELLVACGQLEQAAADTHSSSLRSVEVLTENVALGFVGKFLGAEPKVPPFPESLQGRPNFQLRVREPEGFHFYALYPEQYIESAVAWANAQGRCRRPAVIGIRSIGTTLSAVVWATLIHNGLEPIRVTARPSGPPFGRRVRLPLLHRDAALVVDEGPGLSGSSMASVADALTAQGVKNIAFLPGHPNGPGIQSSDPIKRCWLATPQYVTALESIRWKNRSLRELIIESSKCGGAVSECLDFSAGQWRKYVYPVRNQWPPVCQQFEKMKFLVRFDNGKAWLWKFTGLTAQRQSPCLIKCHGFSAYEWIEGTRADLRTCPRQRLLGSLVSTARPLPEPRAALQRLKRIVGVNVMELLGPGAAAKALALCPKIPPPYPRGVDGRIAFHDWIILQDGQVANPNAATEDHTAPGAQPMVWDLAAMAIEWKWPLLQPCHLPGLPPVPRKLLLFYMVAYLAWRVGLSRFAATQDPYLNTVGQEYAVFLEDLLAGRTQHPHWPSRSKFLRTDEHSA